MGNWGEEARSAVLGRPSVREAREESHDLPSLPEDPVDPTRVGVLLATGMGAIETIESGMETLTDQGPRRIGPFFMTMMLGNMASGLAAMRLNAKGPVMATVSACAARPA